MSSNLLPPSSLSDDSPELSPVALENTGPASLEYHTCAHCRKIVIDVRKARTRQFERGFAEFGEEGSAFNIDDFHPPFKSEDVRRRHILLSFSSQDVEEAVKSGCHFWSKVGALSSPIVTLIVVLRAGEGRTSDIRRIDIYPRQHDLGESPKLHTSVPYADKSLYMDVFAEPGRYAFVLAHISVLTKPNTEDISSRFFRQRPIQRHLGSDSSFELMRSWYETCRSDHQHRNTHASFAPKRLIEIVEGSSFVLRLRNNMENSGQPYIALSYCWGPPPHLQVKKFSLDGWDASIPTENLPQTIKDAVTVAHQLGITYLWVDSLCIVQDDESDKALQLSQMSQIYKSATVTVIASRAHKASEGFLGQRNLQIKEPRLRLPYKCPLSGDLGSILLCPILQEPEEPVDKRAWCLQERILSPIVLEFGTTQTRWICSESQLREGFTDGGVPEFGRESREYRINPHHYEKYSKSKSRGHRGHVGLWERTVEKYSRMGITNAEDWLDAISALAMEYSKYFEGRYFAGLWESHILPQLIWYRYPPSDEIPVHHLFPSWSWAGHSNIDYVRNSFLRFEVRFIDCKIVPRNEQSVFGSVESGTLQLEGRIQSAWLVRSGKTEFKIVDTNPEDVTSDSLYLYLDYYPGEFLDDNEVTTPNVPTPCPRN